MPQLTREDIEKLKALTDVEKLALVDSILLELDRPDPEMDRIWADEAGRRWQACCEGRAESTDYAEVMAKYRRH
jgi:hypothetical protein